MSSDRRQLLESGAVGLRVALRANQSTVWTALPGIVASFDPVRLTCEVRPAIMAEVRDARGKPSWAELPLLVDCPVQFASGGGVTMTFPVAPGDEVLVVFASRCIDSWWQSGGVAVQAEFRMHDLSDGFVIPGVRSQRRLLPAISTNSAQLRTDDGTAFVGVAAGGAITVSTPGDVSVSALGQVTITSPTITLNGHVVVNGDITHTGNQTTTGGIVATGEITGAGTTLHRHQHGGVRNGDSLTGPPSNF